MRAYLWGDDLSNTVQGAGGVGGLLAVRRYPAAEPGPGPAWLIPFYGANGNITAGMDVGAPAASTPPQTMAVARWNYTPFGERFGDEAAKGAELCPIGFSTKYEDVETGLCYYGYRYYHAEMGRWLNRDPVGEEGGINLYQICDNDPLTKYDVLGLLFPSFMNPNMGASTAAKIATEAAIANMIGGDQLDNTLIHHLVWGEGKDLRIDAPPNRDIINDTLREWRKRHKVINTAINEACDCGFSQLASRQVSTYTSVKLIHSMEVKLEGKFTGSFLGGRPRWNFDGKMQFVDERIDFNMATQPNIPRTWNQAGRNFSRNFLTGVGALGDAVGAIDPFTILWTNPQLDLKESGFCRE